MNDNETNKFPTENDPLTSEEREEQMADEQSEPLSPEVTDEEEPQEGFAFDMTSLVIGVAFCFFIAPLGALMALVMPGIGFEAYPIYLPRMLGYFGTHFMIFIEGLAIVTFGLYRPQWRDIPLTMLALFVIALVVFGINMLLRATGLHPKANYFFSVETEGNPLLELFYSWLPWPFLFLLPSIVIVAVYAGVITACFDIAGRLRAKKRGKAAVSG